MCKYVLQAWYLAVKNGLQSAEPGAKSLCSETNLHVFSTQSEDALQNHFIPLGKKNYHSSNESFRLNAYLNSLS